MRLGGSIVVALLLLLPPSLARAEDDPRRAADAFGRALTTGSAKALRPLLPDKGKVRLELDRLGPAHGSYSGSQVEAILGDFLAEGSVGSFETLRVDGNDDSFSLVRGRATLTDRGGRPARVIVHLSFELEAQRWVLRGIKEAAE